MTRRFQFGLLGLFALTFLMAIICAIWVFCLNVAYPARLLIFGVAVFLVLILANVFWDLVRGYSGIMREVRKIRAQGKEPTPMEWKEIYERVSWSVMETTPLMGRKQLSEIGRKWQVKQEQAEGNESRRS